ncbi:hypothetical protein [Mesorhizobium sp. M1378]|uniref:hypothetical protein n=1 Tax=Mesorhizobium sp. M1378 TaxID=2957092 RepID=UPI00333A9C31
MSRYGAKVLHHRAVDYAEKHAVTIVCKSLTSPGAITGAIVPGQGNARSVTLARDAPVLSRASLGERDNLHALLDKYDISAIGMEDNCGAGICIISDVDFAMRLAALTGTRSVSIGWRTVVTELDSSVPRVHLDDNYERDISSARQIHEQMYPGLG